MDVLILFLVIAVGVSLLLAIGVLFAALVLKVSDWLYGKWHI